jgi:hypothetical protein
VRRVERRNGRRLARRRGHGFGTRRRRGRIDGGFRRDHSSLGRVGDDQVRIDREADGERQSGHELDAVARTLEFTHARRLPAFVHERDVPDEVPCDHDHLDAKLLPWRVRERILTEPRDDLATERRLVRATLRADATRVRELARDACLWRRRFGARRGRIRQQDEAEEPHDCGAPDHAR